MAPVQTTTTTTTTTTHTHAFPAPLQVLLPPSGGRLVLASDGVWSQAGERLLRTMHTAPLKTAAHEVVRAISTSRWGFALSSWPFRRQGGAC